MARGALIISYAHYLGGLTDSTKKKTGNFAIGDSHLGISLTGNKYNPEILLSEIEGVSFDSETVAKSRAGKAIVFGLLALAAKSSKSIGQMTVHLKNGQIAAFQFDKMSGLEVKAKIMGRLSPLGIPCLDDPQRPSTPVESNLVDQLQSAERLLQSGALSQNEFEALKAKILGI